MISLILGHRERDCGTYSPPNLGKDHTVCRVLDATVLLVQTPQHSSWSLQVCLFYQSIQCEVSHVGSDAWAPGTDDIDFLMLEFHFPTERASANIIGLYLL